MTRPEVWKEAVVGLRPERRHSQRRQESLTLPRFLLMLLVALVLWAGVFVAVAAMWSGMPS